MPVNYMDRLAALRGDHSHAAGASAPVLHADEKKKSRKKKRKLSKKQKAALAKGWRLMKAKRRAEKKMAKKKRKSSKRSAPKRKSKRGYKSAAGRRTARIGAFHRRAHKAGKRVRKRKSKGVTTYTFAPKRKRSKSRKAPKRSKSRKHKKRKSVMGHRKSSKRVAAGKKAARTRKRHKAERAAARRRGGHSKKRHHKKRHAHKRAAPRRRKRGGRARRRSRGLIRRQNRTGKFVGRGGRIHGRKRRGGYHRAGRIVKENYSMENPLDMSELATGLGAGLLGYIAADVADRMIAGRGVLGGTLYAEAAPIYSDYMRLGAGLLMAAAPLVGAHFVNGAKHRHLRAGLQFFGFGAGIRTLGHLFTDLVSSQLKGNATVGPTIQALYPHEIASAGQIAGAKAAGAGALPEQIGEAARGLGMIPEGLAACCNASSRMLNPALSVLQPIGRSAEMGGAAAGFTPPPVALPPPIERIVQQPFSPPSVTRQATPIPMTPAGPPPPGFQQQPQLPPARQVVAATNPMTAAYVPQPALPAPVGAPSFVGPAGLPTSPFAWGNNDSAE